MSKHTDKTDDRPDGRYEKLLKGEITSGQYVKSLRQDAGSLRSSRVRGYSAARSSKRSAAG